MKKKGTRKIRKNKRTTQRRKNRSYKRMRGGVFNFTSKSLVTKQHIPEYVKHDIDKSPIYVNSRNFDDIKGRYSKVINTTDPETKTIYEKYGEKIKEKMNLYTEQTGEKSLTTLSISTTSVEQLIESLKQLGFLPTVDEFIELYKKFYGINEKGVMVPGKAEKDTVHRSPFKFNGFALAVFLVRKYNDQHYDDIKSKSTELSSLLSTPNPDMPPPSFGILQSYLFELGPTDKLFWKTIPTGTTVTANQVCPLRGRIRYIRHGDSESPVTNENRSWLNYGMKTVNDPTSEAGQLSSYFTEMNRLAERGIAIKPGETTSVRYTLHEARDTPHQDGTFSEPKYKKYESRIEIKNIDMTDFKNKSLVDRPMTSYIPVIVITIYEYDEDGMINKVLVTYKFFEITTSKPDLTSLTDRDRKEINLNDRVYREVVTDMETNLKLRLRPSKTLEGMLETDTVIPIDITAKRGDTSTPTGPQVYTLYMTHTPHTHWTAQRASPIQNIAFNAVNDYIRTHEWVMSNPVKRFLIENNDEAGKIAVVIEVKELTSANTLKRATYCGEEMSEYELFNTKENADSNARAKLANYNQVTSSGPTGF